LNWNDVSRLERGRDEVKKRVEDLERMTTTCRRLTELLKELTGLLDDPAKFNRRLKEVDRLRAEVRQQERTYQMISAVAQLAELQRYSADRRLELAGVEGKERARGQLQRDIRFVEAVIEGAEVLREILDECLGRFDMAMAATQSEK